MTPKEIVFLIINLVFSAAAVIAYARGEVSGEVLGFILVSTGIPGGYLPAVRAFADKLKKDASGNGSLIVACLSALATLGVGAALMACAAALSRPTAYEAQLIECNATATTKRESIDCENQVRARFPLPDGAPRPRREGGTP